jgi:hypothetical protein
MSTDAQAEFEWLQAHPQFVERPASLAEFLGSDYLAIEDRVRQRIRDALVEIMGEEVQSENPSKVLRAIMVGGIGIGKTTIASIVLCYLVHWTLCLRNPQQYFGLLDGSRIAFMMMSTSERQAKDVIFGDVKERILYSPWFKKYPYDPKFKNRFEFPKHVVIIPGGSEDTQFEGYNVLGGVIDEIDSHKVTERKMYAQVGYETIVNRITSRYGDKGLIVLIGQRKSQSGFAEMMYQEFQNRPDAYAENMTIWESRGDDFYADENGEVQKFYYDVMRKQTIPPQVISEGLIEVDDENILAIPQLYYDEFRRQPEKALKDLAGLPPAVGDPFISLTHKIHECVDRWVADYGDEPPVGPDGRLASWFNCRETLRRVGHLDIGFSGAGDALGFAMGHVREMVEIDGEHKPYIVFDLLYQKTAPPGHEIFLGEVRHFIYDLRHQHKFKLELVTMDGFESSDTMQQLPRRRIYTDYLSVDKQMLPYYDLREAIYEDRVAFPPYMVRSRQDDTKLVNIATQELSELVDAGKKVDHPPTGSKDVADSMAGVTFTLMGDRRYHRKVTSIAQYRQQQRVVGDDSLHPAYLGSPEVHAPAPPPGIGATGPRGVVR